MSLISYLKARLYRYRSAVTGRFIKKIEADENPDTTISEAQHPGRRSVKKILEDHKNEY